MAENTTNSHDITNTAPQQASAASPTSINSISSSSETSPCSSPISRRSTAASFMSTEADPLFIDDAPPPILVLPAAPNNADVLQAAREAAELARDVVSVGFRIDQTNTGNSYIKIRLRSLDTFKYITVEPEVFTDEQLQTIDRPELVHLLPTLPGGNWMQIVVSRNQAQNQVYYHHMSTEIPSVTAIWHPIQVQASDLRIYRFIRDRTHVYRAPGFTEPVVVKMAHLLQDVPYIDRENQAYRYLSSNKAVDIGPKFLGHVMEHGRCIGFILEWVKYYREAYIVDYDLCVKALEDLRGMSLKHGDIDPSNFLIQYNRAVMVDFERVLCAQDEEEFEREKDQLKYLLVAKSSYLVGLTDTKTTVPPENTDSNGRRPWESNRNYIRRLMFGEFALPYMEDLFEWEDGELVARPNPQFAGSQFMWHDYSSMRRALPG